VCCLFSGLQNNSCFACTHYHQGSLPQSILIGVAVLCLVHSQQKHKILLVGDLVLFADMGFFYEFSMIFFFLGFEVRI